MPHLPSNLRRSSHALIRGIEWFIHGGVDLLFSPTCLLCGQLFEGPSISRDSIPFCKSCQQGLVTRGRPACSRCGSGVICDAEEEFLDSVATCLSCRGRPYAFDEVVRLGLYEGKLREIILRMKNRSEQDLSMGLGRLLWDQWGNTLAVSKPELVVSVPSHWRRRMSRGADSSEELAGLLARKLRIPHISRLLVRQRNTLPQFELTPEQRFRNVRGAFALSRAYTFEAKRVLLVDDILTTGATCHAAAQALRSEGAEQIVVAVSARAVKG